MILLCFGLIVAAVIIGVLVYLLLAGLFSVEIFILAVVITISVCATVIVLAKKIINKRKEKKQ